MTMFPPTFGRKWKRFWPVVDVLALILKILFGKGDVIMAIVYATLIIKGKKTFADVPDKLKAQVRELLNDLDCPELAQ